MGWSRRIVENLLQRGGELRCRARGFPGLGVAVEAGEVAARQVEPNPVTRFELIGDRCDVDLDLVRIAHSGHSVDHVPGFPVRIDIDQLGGEVGVFGVG